MKNLMTITIFLFILPLKFYGQCFTFTLTITPPSCPSCCDGMAAVTNLTGGCPPYLYIWSTGSSIPESNMCFDTTYTLTIIDAGSCCPDTTIPCRINSSTNIINVQSENSIFTFYPNPTSNTLNVQSKINNSNDLTFDILDNSGKLISTNKLNCTINVSDLLNGEYFISLKRGSEIIETKKWVKIK